MRNILVTVRGGVAEVVENTVPEGVRVEIIDFDNLQDLSDPTTPRFSNAALKYVGRTDKNLAGQLEALRMTVRR